MHFVYVIYSKSMDQFYVGETSDLEQRLSWHRSHEFKGASTKIAEDWELCWNHDCGRIEVARRIEARIKKMKSRKYYADLRTYSEIITRLFT